MSQNMGINWGLNPEPSSGLLDRCAYELGTQQQKSRRQALKAIAYGSICL